MPFHCYTNRLVKRLSNLHVMLPQRWQELSSDIRFYNIETLQLPTGGNLSPQETKFEANLMLSIKGELNIGGISHHMWRLWNKDALKFRLPVSFFGDMLKPTSHAKTKYPMVPTHPPSPYIPTILVPKHTIFSNKKKHCKDSTPKSQICPDYWLVESVQRYFCKTFHKCPRQDCILDCVVVFEKCRR